MQEVSAVVLAGGTGERLGGVDKANLTYAGRSLLARALDALPPAAPVIVVGPQTPTHRPVRFVREEPPLGGPAAGLLAGRDALGSVGGLLVVLAVDMAGVTEATVRRLVAAADGADGAILVDAQGRRQLALAVEIGRLDAARPPLGDESGLPIHRLLAGLTLVEIRADGDEALDVDTWSDLRRGLRAAARATNVGPVNLHDWIDELCDALEVETEVDEGLVLDLARTAAHNVERPAAPITTYLLGFAAGRANAKPDAIERLAARAQALADEWDRPPGAPDPVDIDDEVPDDSSIDHTGETFEED